MVGSNIVSFIYAVKLPRSMLETFFEIDTVYGKMEAQKLEKELKKK